MLRSVDKRLGDEAVFLLSGGDEKMHLYVKVRNTTDNYSMLSISLSRVGNELNEEQIVCRRSFKRNPKEHSRYDYQTFVTLFLPSQ